MGGVGDVLSRCGIGALSLRFCPEPVLPIDDRQLVDRL
jgi:hypothetical protein